MLTMWTHKSFLLFCSFSASLAVSITTYGDFTENSTVTLACSIEQFTSTASWSNDNTIPIVRCSNTGWCSLTNDPAIRFSANTTGIYLVIRPLTSAIKTMWYCAYNGIVAKVSITILEQPSSDPTIYTNQTGPVISGDTLKVTCEVDGGKPLANIYWECIGTFNEQNTSTDIKAISSVLLNVTKTDDNKVCRCKSSHPLWSTNKTVDAILNVLYAPDTIPSIEQSPPGAIFAGNKVTLTCTVSGGKPLPVLSWDCDGIHINDTSGNRASYSVELSVNKTYNNKVCTCSATHPQSSYKPAVRHGLIVYYAPETNPVIQQTPPGHIVTGNNVTLTCTVSGGNPLANLSWDCNGVIANNSNGSTSSYSVQLVVDKTYDNKVCTCSATHPVSTYTPTIQHRLIVYYEPDTPPDIQQSPPGSIIVGTNVTLTCTVSGGKPLATLSWDCNGKNTNKTSGNSASYSVELSVDKTYNNRACTCSATHPVSSYRPTVHHVLQVYYAPDTDPSIMQTPTGAIITGNNVILTCNVSGGNPLPKLSWNCTGNTTNNTSVNTASYSIELTVNKTYNNKVCTCSATHPVSTYRPTIQHGFTVFYAPDTIPSIRQSPPGPIITGNKVTLTCTVSGGNPLPTLFWDCKGNTTYNTSMDTSSYNIELTVDKTYNNKVCTCSATHPVSTYKPTIQHGLTVYFAPIVAINRNETVELLEGMDITLTCNATGNPPTYTYHGWTQTFENTTVRALNNTRNELTLFGLSYMDIGNYTCLVDNKISDYQNNTIQSASTFITIKFKPVFLDKNEIFTGKKDGNMTARIKLFSYPDIYKPVTWTNASDNSIIGNRSNMFLSLRQTPIMTKFHDAQVLVDTFAYESVLQLTSFQLQHQGFYTLQVNNSFSNNNLTVRIVISDIPQAPKNFSVKELSSTMVTLVWTAGFNGGNPQTFTITYVKENTLEYNSIRKTETSYSNEYEVVILDLIPSTTYIFNITSANIEGTAFQENNTLTVVTDSVKETAETQIIGPIAGSLTGLLGATLVVTIMIFYIRKKKGKEKEDSARSLTNSGNLTGEDDLHDNILYESSGQHSEDKLETSSVEYASVNKNKPNDNTLRETAFYSDVKKMAKPKPKGKTTQKENVTNEDVYENMEHTFPREADEKNKDGLQYADLIFNPTPKGAKYIIHGLEDKTVYAEVDTTQKIDPLPESDDEVPDRKHHSEIYR